MNEVENASSLVKQSRDMISQLKEMGHYSKTNVEKLSNFWLQLEEEIKKPEFAKQVEKLLNLESQFHEVTEQLVSDFEIECNRIENESG